MTLTTTTGELWAAVETFDAETAEIALAKLLWDVPLSGAVTGVVLPFLREVGDQVARRSRERDEVSAISGEPALLSACDPGCEFAR